MTVNPGYGGQAYLTAMEPKIAAVRALADEAHHEVEIEVDGGVGEGTIGSAAAAGADLFVSGSAVWQYPTVSAGIDDLRQRAGTAATGGDNDHIAPQATVPREVG